MLNSFARIPRQQASQTVTVAAPIGGWNARDALGAMDPLDAVTLQNFWPGTNSVILRNGYTKHATGLPAQVQTLMAYSSGTANKLFAVSDGKIYDATNTGAVGSAAVTGLTNSKFQYVNITTPGGSYLMAVNGADKLRTFDGTNWHTDGDGSPYDITNVDTATVSNITLFKNRIWLTTSNTLKAWYLPVNSIGGVVCVAIPSLAHIPIPTKVRVIYVQFPTIGIPACKVTPALGDVVHHKLLLLPLVIRHIQDQLIFFWVIQQRPPKITAISRYCHAHGILNLVGNRYPWIKP